MERYFNTLKNECINLYEFTTEEALYQTVEEFAYVAYNHVRPHSFNAPMERYFNTLKNECINLYEFTTEEALYQTVEEFAYVAYNHVRPHSFNSYCTPFETRNAA